MNEKLNIVYITYLFGLKYTGPNYSVPNKIEYQSKYDNVFWYNINDLYEGDHNKVKHHNLSEYPTKKLKDLPFPFNKPDLVIFEGVYFVDFIKLGKECEKLKVPYIVTPRSSLTKEALKNKRVKKYIANKLVFNKFLKKSRAIHFLTDNERKSSSLSYTKNSFVIPNGIEIPNYTKIVENKTQIKGVFVGRIDSYQKGLDVFLKACLLVKDTLRDKMKIEIYGPDQKNEKKELLRYINKNNLEDIITIHPEIFDTEKKELLKSIDFFILPSRFEGHPMGLIEALSYSLPSLVTPGTNMAEEIKRYDSGWASEMSAADIAVALKNVVENKSQFKDKSQNAKKLASKYSWEKIARDSHNIYVNLLLKKE